MQGHFIKSFKRSIFSRPTLIAIIIGFLCLVISYIIRNFDMLKEYFFIDMSSIEGQGLDLNAKLRLNQEAKDHLFVSLFNFDSFIRSAQWIYLYIINILAILPVLTYYDKRKSGFLKSVFIRTGYKKYIWTEGLSAVFTGGIIAFVPYFIYWFTGAVLIPSNLGEDMGMVSTYFSKLYDFNPFSLIHTSIQQLKWYWLIFIALIGIYGMCISFLTFVFANIVNKKVILFVIPFSYYYLVNTIFSYFNIERYSVVGLIAYFSHTNSSLPNILLPIAVSYDFNNYLFCQSNKGENC